MNKIYYAGIGSREVPEYVGVLMASYAKLLSRCNSVLRSGGAKGSDSLFEKGCDTHCGDKEIYLPWYGFENNGSKLIVSNPKAFEIAEKYHPYWHNLKQGARKLQARNSHQVLGLDLETPCDFILCYTKNGKMKGGTSQALRIAKDYNIPIFNFGDYEDMDKVSMFYTVKRDLDKFLKEFIPDLESIRCMR